MQWTVVIYILLFTWPFFEYVSPLIAREVSRLLLRIQKSVLDKKRHILRNRRDLPIPDPSVQQSCHKDSRHDEFVIFSEPAEIFQIDKYLRHLMPQASKIIVQVDASQAYDSQSLEALEWMGIDLVSLESSETNKKNSSFLTVNDLHNFLVDQKILVLS